MTDTRRTDDANGARRLVELVNGYRSAKVVFVAHELGLFRALDSGPLRDVAVAEALKLDPRATSLLLRSLAALELLQCSEGVFSNAAVASAHLVPGKPGYLGHNLTYQDLLWDAWSELASTVRSGKPKADLLELLSRGPANFSRDYLKAVESVSRPVAAEVARLLLRPGLQRSLDVGGGRGTYCRAFVEAVPGLQATLLDLPSTLEEARAGFEGYVHSDRITLQPANYLEDDFGGPFDVVLLSHVTHDESPQGTLLLLKKGFGALKSGGEVAVHDFVVSADGCSPPFATLFSVNMLVYTKGGQVYSVEEYEGMMREAGFTALRSETVLAGKIEHHTTLVIGRKP